LANNKKFSSNLSRFVDPNANPDSVEGIGAASMFVRHQIDEETKRKVQKALGIIPSEITIAEDELSATAEPELTLVPPPVIIAEDTVVDERPSEEDLLVKITGHRGEVETLSRNLLVPAPSEWNFFSKPPRHKFEEMLKSIHRYGLFQPIIVWEQLDGTYMILGGHTRELIFDELYQATGEEKWLEMMCRIYRHETLTALEAQEIVMDSNYAQRSELSPTDRGKCYWAKSKIYKSRIEWGSGIDINQMVAKHYNIHRDTVFFYKRLDNLIPVFGDWMMSGKLGAVGAAKLAAYDQSVQQWLHQAYEDKLTPERLAKLTTKMSAAEIEAILTASDEVKKKYRVIIEMEDKPPKDHVPFTFFVKPDQLEAVKDAFRSILESAATSEEIKQLIKDQLD
jgi:ParB family chromosome partitioning protein